MPKQEVFFVQETADGRIEVLKTYDEQYAREAFNSMDEEATAHLWNSLKPEELYDPAGLPTNEESEERAAFLWDELVEQAREEWNTFSYFVVTQTRGLHVENRYVSADWPSAEAFAKQQISALG